MFKWSYFIISILAISTLASCGKEDRTQLTVEERKEVNEVYKNILDSLNVTMLNQCDEYKAKNFTRIVDSLKETRLNEIRLITKVKGDE